MRSCWRCGVDFDGAKYRPEAPCADCQLDVPGDWVLGWKRGNVPSDVRHAHDETIKFLYEKRLSDREISEHLGISTRTVQRRRKVLGLPGHKFDPDEKWGDGAREKMLEASLAFWADPDSRAAWIANHPRRGKPVPQDKQTGSMNNPDRTAVRYAWYGLNNWRNK